ncbi:hypothetical protein [Micromonospora sp. CA-246542]|uniref:hypothetical protein n=1 Tax=Micromonospora sp. CA-246542 TaxID=3239959 RepID=UPI003D8F3417
MDEPQWMVYAGFAFDALASSAGVIAIFIAVRAYKVAKRQGRVDLQLGALRELLQLTLNSEFREAVKSGPVQAISSFGVFVPLRMFNPDELGAWNALQGSVEMPAAVDLFRGAPMGRIAAVKEHDDVFEEFLIWEGLRNELYAAIERRME